MHTKREREGDMKTISCLLITGAAAICSIGQTGHFQGESKVMAGLFFVAIGVALLQKAGTWLGKSDSL
jgi:hypothetical protein